MRALVFLAMAVLPLRAQSAGQDADRAYAALRVRDYDAAIAAFRAAIDAAPERASIRKDLAYTYVKVGEPEAARDQFREAMRLDAADTTAALEYAFLCNETKQQAEARRIFDAIRKAGNATAEQAFRNIDDPLAEGIGRWTKAVELGADNVAAHTELARLAEQRGDLPLAAEHFERCWRLKPEKRAFLVDLGRVWQAVGRLDDAAAALLAASRGGEPRAAEQARELLPARYPFVGEFRRALALDPANHELRRELGYLLLRMGREAEAEIEFRLLTQNAPDDLLSATQLGFLLYARGEKIAAMPLFERVLAGSDEDLANRVRAVLRMPQVLRPRAAAPQSIDAKVMAERSIKAGYLKDALKYLEAAHETDPGDFDVMLQLGWTNNLLKRDATAYRWFDLARRSPDPKIAAEAAKGFRNLRPVTERLRTSLWVFPMFSTRWHDVFAYAQVKTEINTGMGWVRPYASVRFVGDTRGTVGIGTPQYLSESAFIVAVGASSAPWHGFTAWGEAGSSIGYLSRHLSPDYRGGVSGGRTWRRERWYATGTVDALYMSRFGKDFLVYTQTRAGWRALTWNFDVTVDARRQDWANFVETGPGIRVPLPQAMYLTFNALRGRYLVDSPARRVEFNDLRAGFWYAISR